MALFGLVASYAASAVQTRGKPINPSFPLVACSASPTDEGDSYDADQTAPPEATDAPDRKADEYQDYLDLQAELDALDNLETKDIKETEEIEVDGEIEDNKEIEVDGDSEDIEETEVDGDSEDNKETEEYETQLPTCLELPDFLSACSSGIGECKAPGVMVCSEDMTKLVCSASPNPPMPEVCDGKDNNCNNVIDDLNVCFTNYFCDNDKDSFLSKISSGTCDFYGCVPDNCSKTPGNDCSDLNPQINPSVPDVCDGIDNNCNGQTDEGFPQGIACFEGKGECLTEGELYCDPNTGSIKCSAVPPAPQDEVCDNKDNDCNGFVDDNIVCNDIPYYCDNDKDTVIGTETSGTAASFETIPQGCSPTPGNDCDDTNPLVNPLAIEECDNLDQNCNGIIDDMPPEDYYPADPLTMGVGECKKGMKVCVNGQMMTVIDPILPKLETCNNKDDDCDNIPDEDTTITISTGHDYIGPCLPEIKVCENGILKISQPMVSPKIEVCDNIDNDCDDSIDNNGACYNLYYCDTDSDSHYSNIPAGICQSFNCVETQHPECSVVPGDDCNDLNPLVYPDASPGQCIDVDFNCDGQVSFAKLTDEIRISNDPGESWDPSVATNGEVYFITWKDNREGTYNGYYSMVGNDGTIIVPETAFTTNGDIGRPKTIWNGNIFIVVWDNKNYSLQPDIYCFPEIMFTRFDPNGTKLQENTQLISGQSCYFGNVSLAWCQNNLAIAYQDYKTTLLLKSDSSGNLLMGPTIVSDPTAVAAGVSISCSNMGYGMSLGDRRDDPPGLGLGEIYYAQADNNGSKIGNDFRITNNNSGGSEQNEDSNPAIICHDQECGIIWTGESWHRATKFMRISLNNGVSIIGSEQTIETSEYYTLPKIIWDGQNYILSWTNQTPNGSGKQEIHMARLSSSGQLLNISNVINHPTFTTTGPSLTLNGTEHTFGLGWTDGRDHLPNVDNNWETYFSIIGCQ